MELSRGEKRRRDHVCACRERAQRNRRRGCRPQIVLRREYLDLAMRVAGRRGIVRKLDQTAGEALRICDRQSYREQNENPGPCAPHVPSD
jgi:hypothetical protein